MFRRPSAWHKNEKLERIMKIITQSCLLPVLVTIIPGIFSCYYYWYILFEHSHCSSRSAKNSLVTLVSFWGEQCGDQWWSGQAETRTQPWLEVGDETKSCLPEMSASLLRLTQSLLESSVCTNILGLIVWGSLDSDNLTSFNVFILPILQLGMSAISEKIQRILRSRVQADPSSLPTNTEGQMSENRIKLRYQEEGETPRN